MSGKKLRGPTIGGFALVGFLCVKVLAPFLKTAETGYICRKQKA